MGTKNNPGKFDCYDNAEPDEPMFVILARDPVASMLVRTWAHIRKVMGEEPAMIREAVDCADAMDHWRMEHRPLKTRPHWVIDLDDAIKAIVSAISTVRRSTQQNP